MYNFSFFERTKNQKLVENLINQISTETLYRKIRYKNTNHKKKIITLLNNLYLSYYIYVLLIVILKSVHLYKITYTILIYNTYIYKTIIYKILEDNL